MKTFLNEAYEKMGPWITETLNATVKNFRNGASEHIDKITSKHIQQVDGYTETTIAQSTKKIAGEIKDEMQPWIDQQVQLVIDTARKDMQSQFDGFRSSLKPWIMQLVQAEVTSQLNQEKVRKADRKREFAAFQASQNNGQ